MQTVYAVTHGNYSDFTIKGLFSTREKAEKYQADGGFDDIEEYVLDAETETVFRDVWQCAMLASTGEILYQYQRNREAADPHERGNARLFYKEPHTQVVGVSYESPEHALKLATERRQAYLRGEIYNTLKPSFSK